MVLSNKPGLDRETFVRFYSESNQFQIEHRGHVVFSGTVGGCADGITWKENEQPAEAVYLGYPHGPKRASSVPENIIARSIVITITGENAWLEGEVTPSASAFSCDPNDESGIIRGRFGDGDNALDRGVFDVSGDWVLAVDKPSDVRVRRTQQGKYSLNASGPEINLVLYVDFYRIHRGYFFWNPEKKPWDKPVSGWCSWAAHWNKITEDTIVSTAEFIGRELKDYGYDTILMDDGYQDYDCVNPKPLTDGQSVSDIWTRPLDKFPHGLGWLADQISANGLTPGIWISTAVPPGLPKDWYIKDEHGKPFSCDTVKCSINGMIDEAVESGYRQTIRGLKALGWRYFKLDSIRHVLYDSYRNATHYWQSRGEDADVAFRRIFEGIREEIGDSIFMQSCWGTIPELAGIVDGARIGEDVDAHWDSIQAAAKYACQFNYLNNIVWLNDPDYMCFRVPLEQCRTWATITALAGLQLMISDPIESYDEPRLDILRKVGPALHVRPAVLCPVESECEQWVLEINKPDESWLVLGRVAWKSDGLSKRQISFCDLGLSSESSYLVFDFWNEEFIGEFKGAFTADAIPEGSCRVYCIHELKNHPQVVSTNRHIGQGAHELEDVCWQNNILSGKMIFPDEREYSIFVNVPQNYKLTASSPKNAKIEPRGQIVKMTLKAEHNGRADWSLKFEKASGECGK